MPADMLDSTSSSSTSSEDSSFSMTGTRLARFVNNYSPVHDTPRTPLELTSDIYVDDALSAKLMADRQRNVQHHLIADKAFKEFVASRLHNASMMR